MPQRKQWRHPNAQSTTLESSSVDPTAQVEAELTKFHAEFLEKELASLLSWTTPEQRAPYIAAIQSLCKAENRSEFKRLSGAVETLGKALSALANLTEQQREEYGAKVERIIEEAGEETSVYARMQAQKKMEALFGPTEPGNIVVGMGGGFRNADGSFTEFGDSF